MYFLIVETKGPSLEAIAQLFDKNSAFVETEDGSNSVVSAGAGPRTKS